MTTKSSANADLRNAGFPERIEMVEGSFYFVDGNTADWNSTCLCVPTLRDLTNEQVLEAYDGLRYSRENVASIYDNTAAGAIRCLSLESTYNCEGATAIPDPFFNGVWKVTLKDGTNVVVHLYRHDKIVATRYNEFEER